jgi:hypothetical protein
MRKLMIAALLLPMSCPAVAQAQDLDPSMGNGLLALCDDDEQGSFRRGLCFGYIHGVSDAGIALGVVCYPAGVNMKQIDDVVISALRSHPEERHRASWALVTKYLQAAFPCAKK